MNSPVNSLRSAESVPLKDALARGASRENETESPTTLISFKGIPRPSGRTNEPAQLSSLIWKITEISIGVPAGLKVPYHGPAISGVSATAIRPRAHRAAAATMNLTIDFQNCRLTSFATSIRRHDLLAALLYTAAALQDEDGASKNQRLFRPFPFGGIG